MTQQCLTANQELRKFVTIFNFSGNTMSTRYSAAQRFKIAAWYECTKSPIIVQRKFRTEWGKNASIPSRPTIVAIHAKAIEGNLVDLDRTGRPRTSRSDENVDTVMTAFCQSPKKSVRRASGELNLSKTTVHRILKGEKMHPYRLHILHELFDEDLAARRAFAEEMLQVIENDDTFLHQLLFSDEAVFHLSGQVNRHNCVYWSTDNPSHTAMRPLQSPKIVVWMGVWSEGLIGPYVFEDTVTGDSYLGMLREWLLPQLQQIDQFNAGDMFFQQDGAPPHWSRVVREWLDTVFPSRWIGRSGPISWPARSPDLTPLDYWLWGDLKRRVYATHPHSLDELRQRISDEVALISPETRMKALLDFPRRLDACLKSNGGHIEGP